jgi:hypothetical protein
MAQLDIRRIVWNGTGVSDGLLYLTRGNKQELGFVVNKA